MMETEVTIFEKDDMIAAIGRLRIPNAPVGSPEGAVAVYDKRVPGSRILHPFNSQSDIDENYKKALKTTTDREWRIVFRGRPHNDPTYS